MVEDIASTQAWQALLEHPDAQLVDVRTEAEWHFVGIADLSTLDRQMIPISWQSVDGRPNARFIEQLQSTGISPETPLYFLCRSGARSRAAAGLALQAGYKTVFNVADGFEGPLDGMGHRGTIAGWKHAGLSWRQG